MYLTTFLTILLNTHPYHGTFAVAPEFFSGISAPRNKELMRVFKDLKMVEHLGSGLQRILKAYDRNVFEFMPNFIRVTFKFEEEHFEKNNCTDNCTDKEKLIIDLMNSNSKISTKQISEKTKISLRTVKSYIAQLKERGIVNRIGSEKSGYWEIIHHKD